MGRKISFVSVAMASVLMEWISEEQQEDLSIIVHSANLCKGTCSVGRLCGLLPEFSNIMVTLTWLKGTGFIVVHTDAAVEEEIWEFLRSLRKSYEELAMKAKIK